MGRWYTQAAMGEPSSKVGFADLRLEVLKGPREGEVFSFVDGEITVGRDPSNHIPLLDSLVSRHHCVLR